MSTAFSSILDKQSSEIERPKPLPVGSYTCIVKGMPRFDTSAKKGTPFVEFTLQPIAAGDDVDTDALEEMGGFSGRTIRATYYLTEDAAYRLKDFLRHCDAGDDEMTLGERINMTPNCQVIATIKHTASDDGQSIYANLGTTAPVE
jgi:hypothetical protein